MKIKLNEQNFQNLLCYWAGKLRLPLPLLRRDNRIKWSAVVSYCDDCKIFNIAYNFKELKQMKESEIIGLIFHELGHIKDKSYKSRNKIKNEYVAEKYSLKCLKKYYLDFYKAEIEDWKIKLKDKKWRKANPVHAKAFDLIKEYQS